MEFAVNYSEPLVRLLEKDAVHIDRIKCPAWPDLIEKAMAIMPCYVHLPLGIGNGIGDAFNSETQQKVDWDFIEGLIKKTNTPMINLHLSPRKTVYPELSNDPYDTISYEQILEASSKDLEAVIRRWGKEMILVENPFPDARGVPVSIRPDLTKTLVESFDVGFLFDISHARLDSRDLNMSEMSFVMSLPLDRTAEIHLTGIRTIEGEFAAKLLEHKPKDFDIEDYLGKDIDHQSMTEDDFDFLDKIYALITDGIIRKPWIASMEHGGVGPFWELSLDEDTLAVQLPKLYNRTHAVA